jgi:2-methylcitrate dehydratase PrpD
MLGLSARLAEWSATVDLARLPSEVVSETKLRILDILGAMLGGTETELAAKARRAAAEEPGGGATLVGFGDKAAPETAALVNGILAHVLEFDDTHVEGAVHPSSPVLAAVLPVAEQRRVPGHRLVEAVLIGNELACRLACVAPGMLHRHGFHPTGVIGIFGGAYALGHLLSLAPRQTADAVGIAGSMSAALMASWEDGADTKSLHAGIAAAAANRAVALARHGIGGPGIVFEGRFGFFRSHVQDPDYELRFDEAARDLGVRWEAMNIASKVYPCGHYIQPFLDAAAALRREHALDDAADIAEVRCAVAEYMVPLICEPVAEKTRPNTPWHARLSLQHSVAELLVTGRLDKRSYAVESLRDPRIRDLAGRVSYGVDPTAADRRKWSGDVAVRLRDGRELRHRFEHMRGTPGNRLRTEDIVEKFQANASGVLPPAAADRCVTTALALERLEDTSELIASVAP